MKQPGIEISLLLLASLCGFGQTHPQHSHLDFWRASDMIIEESLPSTTVPKYGPAEIESNDAIQAVSFEEALTYWKEVLEKEPDNANFNYKAGLCYFFSYDKQLKALPYFTRAAKNLASDYDFSNDKEKRAPYTALFFLASTFLENNQPDSALKYFSIYQDHFQTVPINHGRGMSMAINAREGAKKPRNVTITSLGDMINTKYAETNPVMNQDSKLLFFSSRRPKKEEKDTTGEKLFNADIYFVSKNLEDKWEEPKQFPYNTEEDEAPLFLTPNGNVLYFRKRIKHHHHFDIFRTELVDNKWSLPEPVTAVNSGYNETGFCMSNDEKFLYFSSDRNLEKGKYDIFRCEKMGNGKWDEPELLSSMINSPYNELYPHISADGKTLFFSSDVSSKKGMGSYDIYYSELKNDNTWKDPTNLGYPICKTRSDINYYVSGNNKRYYSTLTTDNSYDIFMVEGQEFDLENKAGGTDMKVMNEMGITPMGGTQINAPNFVETIVEKDGKFIKTQVFTTEGLNAEEKKVSFDFESVKLDELDEKSVSSIVDKVKQYLNLGLSENVQVVHKILHFDLNQKKLTAATKTELRSVVALMKQQAGAKLLIVGHADVTGSWHHNNALSTGRAQEVYNFLIKNKVSPNRMHFFGKGTASPFAANDTEEGKSKNRRVEIILVN